VPSRLGLIPRLKEGIDEYTDDSRDVQDGCSTQRVVSEPLKKTLDGDHDFITLFSDSLDLHRT
jgi:hypothetical protein